MVQPQLELFTFVNCASTDFSTSFRAFFCNNDCHKQQIDLIVNSVLIKVFSIGSQQFSYDFLNMMYNKVINMLLSKTNAIKISFEQYFKTMWVINRLPLSVISDSNFKILLKFFLNKGKSWMELALVKRSFYCWNETIQFHLHHLITDMRKSYLNQKAINRSKN